MKILGKTLAKSIILGGDPAARMINWTGDCVGKYILKVNPDYRFGMARKQAKEILSTKGLTVKWDPLRIRMVTDKQNCSYLGMLGLVFRKSMTGERLPNGLKIREYTRLNNNLIKAFLELEGVSFVRAYQFDGTEFNIKKYSADFRAVFLEDKKGSLVGATVAWRDKSLPSDIYYISSLCLVSKYRGHGLGKVLLERMFTAAKSLGYKKIALYPLIADVDGRDVVKFYESMGFKQPEIGSWMEVELN